MSSSTPVTGQRRIMLDGHYALQREGTGISTYSRTLAMALQRLGNEVVLLSGADAPRKPDNLTDPVQIADAPTPPTGLRRNVQTALYMLGGLATDRVKPRRVADHTAVLSDNEAHPATASYLAPNVFVHAHYRHMLLRKFVEVNVSQECDVLHLTAPMPVQAKGVARVTTIHDLIPIRLPFTTPDNKSEYIARVRTCAAQSDLIVTVSEASKRDIGEILETPPEKICVTYQPGRLEALSPAEETSLPRVLDRMGLQPRSYALFVGALEPKKNLRRLIQAFLETDTDMPLVIVGRPAWKWDEEFGVIDRTVSEKARKRLRFTGYLPNSDVRFLYAGARMFLFPSLYEGFGLPALDALIFGCPVVTSRTSSLPEVCGDAAVYVDPFDGTSIRTGIETLMSDATLESRLRHEGPIQAQGFSLDAYDRRLAGAYARLPK